MVFQAAGSPELDPAEERISGRDLEGSKLRYFLLGLLWFFMLWSCNPCWLLQLSSSGRPEALLLSI